MKKTIIILTFIFSWSIFFNKKGGPVIFPGHGIATPHPPTEVCKTPTPPRPIPVPFAASISSGCPNVGPN